MEQDVKKSYRFLNIYVVYMKASLCSQFERNGRSGQL